MRSLAARSDLGDMAARADVIAALCGMLEVLRGGACRGVAAAGPPARVAGWALVGELLASLLVLQRAFGDDPRVGALLLKLAAAVVEHHVGYLQVMGERGQRGDAGGSAGPCVAGAVEDAGLRTETGYSLPVFSQREVAHHYLLPTSSA